MVATTALAATGDKEFIQTIGLDPMKITGLRFVELDDSPKGYKITQTIQSPGDMGKTGAYVNDIDVNGKYVAASGLTDDGRSGSIVVWVRLCLTSVLGGGLRMHPLLFLRSDCSAIQDLLQALILRAQVWWSSK